MTIDSQIAWLYEKFHRGHTISWMSAADSRGISSLHRRLADYRHKYPEDVILSQWALRPKGKPRFKKYWLEKK